MAKKKQARTKRNSTQKSMSNFGLVEYVSKPVAKSLIWLAIVLAVWQSKTVWQEHVLPIKSIHVIGAVDQVKPIELRNRLEGFFGQSLLFASLEDAHRLVVNEPWVKSAAFKRSWPNQLVVKVEEQQVVAVLNERLLVNSEYKVFHSVSEDYDSADLTKITTEPSQIEHVMQTLVTMMELFDNKKIGIDTVEFSQRGAWELLLSNQTRLKLGRNDVLNRVKRYVGLLPVFKKQNKEMVSADLRYDTGLAVKWASESGEDRLSGN